MNFELFIARKMTGSSADRNSISAPVIRIAIVSIALGMIVMLLSVATGSGLQQKIRNKVIGFGGHIQISNFDNNISYESSPIYKNQDFYPSIEKLDGINHIQIAATKSAIIKTETDFEGAVLKGVGQNFQWNFFEEYLREGRLPEFTADKASKEVLLSTKIADKLDLKVGDKLYMYFIQTPPKPTRVRAFTITGLYNSGLEDFDKLFVLGDIRQIQKLNKWTEDEIGFFEVIIDDYEQMDEMEALVNEHTPYHLRSRSVKRMYASFFDWVALFDVNIIVIIVIMILVASINMITSLLILILERTQMIGLLKSMGANNVSIRKIFIYNASHLILKGLFWGNLIGISICLIQKYTGIITLDETNYYVKEAPIQLSLMKIVLLNLFTFVVSAAMLIIPSLLASRISPVKSIKFN